MIYFLFQILINAIAVILTVLLMPGVHVPREGILGWIVIGFTFGLLNAIVRPLVVIFTGRLVIRTMGLFIIVINALLLFVLAAIFNWQIDSLFALLVGGALVGVILALLDAIFGINRPLLGKDSVRMSIWRNLIRFSGNRANQLIVNVRMQQVSDITYRYLLEIGLDRVPIIAGIRERMGRFLFKDSTTTIAGLTTPAQVRVMLQTLGPTFVKFGQMLSSRSEALPKEWQEEFAKLQSSVPPFDSELAKQIVEKELRKPVDELFAQFDMTPFAAASTAQVHKATLKDGSAAVVKVQRPDIVPQMNADLIMLQEILRTLSGRFQWMQENDVLGIFDQFSKNVLEELDYRNESFNARRLQELMAVFPEVKVPNMYGQYTTAKVETMEYVSGVKSSNIVAMRAAGWDTPQIARIFLRAMIKQIIFDGYFHGDCHPGNVLINLETGEIIFLDMGMMGNLDQPQRLALGNLIWTLNSMDSYEMSEALLGLSTPYKEVEVSQFREDIDRVVLRYLKYPTEAGSLSEVLNAVFGVLNRNGLHLSSDLTMALKTLIQAEEIVHTLDPTLDITTEAFAYIQDMLVQQFQPDFVQATIKTHAMRTAKELVRRIPDLQQATIQWITQYEKGKFELELKTDELNERLDIFNYAAQRLAIGMVLLGMMIGSPSPRALQQLSGVSICLSSPSSFSQRQ